MVNPAPPGQYRPEPPQEMMPLLVVGRRGELGDPDVPRIQRADEALDAAALAGGVPALEHHAQRRPDPVVADLAAEDQAQVQQPQDRGFQALGALLSRQGRGEVDLGEALHPLSLAPRCAGSYAIAARASSSRPRAGALAPIRIRLAAPPTPGTSHGSGPPGRIGPPPRRRPPG